MAILQITGHDAATVRTLADMLRNHQIAHGKGGLILDPAVGGEPRFLLEKLVAGEAAPQLRADGSPYVPAIHFGVEPGDETLVPHPASEVAWKPGAMVILIGEDRTLLDRFEQIAPGFTATMGGIQRLAIEALDV